MAKAIDFRMGPDILALSFIAITPGFTGSSDSSFSQTETQLKAMVETVVLGSIGVAVTKSWWPLIIPTGYLVYNYAYHTVRNNKLNVSEMEN